jgi:phage portal protein BeeE
MSAETIKALSRIGSGRRSLRWIDERPRSPKALNDMSGVILSRVTTRGSAAIQDFDYDLLSKIYICNDMAWTCINLVSSTAALARLRVKLTQDKDLTYLPDHPLQQVLDFPNASMTQFDMIQSYVTHQLLYGTVTMLLLRQDMLDVCPVCISEGSEDCLHKLYYFKDSPVVQIMPVHPSNIQEKSVEINGKRQNVTFYVPDGVNGKAYPIHPNNMLTDPFYNPDVSWYGVSPTFLLKRWLDLDASMTNQMSQFFENNAIPSMIVSLKPGTNFSYDEEPETLVEKMKQKWMSQFSAKGNTQKAPAFVYGDISIERIQEKVDATIGKPIYYEIQNRVCATFGVPPTLYEMGLRYGAQRASAEQHEKDFYNRTISKILKRFEKKISQLVVPTYKTPGLDVSWDLTDVGIASFLTEKKEDRVERHWLKGLIKRNQALIMLGYEPTDDEFGDDYYRITVMGDGQQSTSNQLDNNLRTPGERAGQLPPVEK